MVSTQHADGQTGPQRILTVTEWAVRDILHGPVVDVGTPIPPSAARRALDITVALTGLALAWPLFVGLAVVSRLSTGGSAIYRQPRVGEGGVAFTLFKFRTMRPWVPGPEVTAPGDHRVTRLGALLRRSSMDELPQLVNVLRGHMTLVGPRPETVSLAARYPADLRFIFRFRPGITGPAQVLVRDEKVLGRAVEVEDFYLTRLVPHRVAVDLDYLNKPTVVMTVAWFVRTLFYLVRTVARLR